MQIIGYDDEEDRIVIRYDSRWQHPESLGYRPTDPQYKCLREMWERIRDAAELVDVDTAVDTAKRRNNDDTSTEESDE